MVASKQLRVGRGNENDGPTKWLSLVMEDGRRKKTKTREDGSHRTGHVIPDKRCGLCGRGFVR